jgi:Dyp-type peroxidase family
MELELNDIQGFVVKGYTYLPLACYKMLKITDAVLAKQWLASLRPQITTANKEARHSSCVNVAVSCFGLRALGLPDDVVQSFAVEFLDYSFDNPVKQHELRILGDVGKNAPAHWEWGGNDQDRQQIHILLMVFASDEAQLNELLARYDKDLTAHKLEGVHQFFSNPMPDEKEHFGFRDGISQPEIEGYNNKNSYEMPIKAGEFILGYPNEYALLPETPEVQASYDAKNILPTLPTKADYKDVGKNGSYMVFRHLEQDVKGFWTFMQEATKEVDGYDVERLGAKVVGRWQSGAPITTCHMHDNAGMNRHNDFGYAETDKDGMQCPIASHIRRSNPRDTFMEDPKKSTAFARKHRLMRRGRSYGVPFVASLSAKDILAKPDDGIKRGLYFLAINANFGRQFNFIQQTWINDGGFQGLSHEPDVLLGSQTEAVNGITTYFSMPQESVRQRIKTHEAYIHVRGSMNFFLPSLRAIDWIANV